MKKTNSKYRKKTLRLKKSLFVLLISITLAASQYIPSAADAVWGQTDDSGTETASGTVLAFTSDVHNGIDNVSADQLASWIDKIQSKFGILDAMGFCGDMADSGDEDNYWGNTQAVMEIVENLGVEGVYTTGNHEFDSGGAQYDNGILVSETGQEVLDRYIVSSEGKEGDNYRIYCLGSTSELQVYEDAERITMENYLMNVGNDKPIIIITHSPLHFCDSYDIWDARTTVHASSVIDVLNNAATNNTPDDPADDRTIIFLWGHNHTLHDSYYDRITVPGKSIEYKQDQYKEIKFYYGAAGCMCDGEYNSGSAFVRGKGLVLQIGADGSLDFGYYDADGEKIAESAEPEQPPQPDTPDVDPAKQMGIDGTALGPGASAAAAEKAITSMKNDRDPAGSVFSVLKLRSAKQGKKSVVLKWTRSGKAARYVIYGNRCGDAKKMKRIAVTQTNTYTVKKAVSKLAKGKYYKFIVVALDNKDNVVSSSKVIHVATAGAKAGNHKKVVIKKKVTGKAANLRKGKTLKLGAKLVKPSGKKVVKHCKLRYETTNKKIATVSGKGTVKGIGKGTCCIYAFAQNGVFKKIKVTVR